MKNNLLILIAMGCTATLQFVLMRNMLSLGGKELLGNYTFALGICGPIFVFFNLGLRNIINSKSAYRYNINDIFTLKLISLTVSMVFSFLIIDFYSKSTESKAIFYFVVAYKFLESVCEFSIANYIVSKRAFRYSVSSFLKLAFVSVFFYLYSRNDWSADNVLVYAILIYLVSSLVDIFELFKYRCSFVLNRNLLMKSILLGTSSLIATMIVAYPRIFLGNEGYLDVLADLGMVLTMVSIVGMCWSSYLQNNLSKLSKIYSSNVREGNLHFIKNYIFLILFSAPFVFIIAVFFGNDILSLVFGIKLVYSQPELYAVVVVSISTLLQATSNNLLVARGKAGVLTYVNGLFFTGIVVLINVLFSGTFLSMLIIISMLLIINALVGIYIGTRKDVLKTNFE
ncbi:hypothetical protein AB4143_10050 [Vibrio breoganii]